MKFLDSNGLLYLIQKIKTWLNGKVDKVDGKGLSTNDYTTTEKNKLAGISTGANKTVVNNTLTSTSTTEALSAAQGKELKQQIDDTNEGFGIWASGITNMIPTNNNQLTNGAGYQTESQVTSLIGSAIADIQGISYEIVTSLPSTGKAGVIYLKSNSGSNPNSYDEYIYVNNKFEKIGTTDVDLTDYALKSQIPTKVSQLTNDSKYLTSYTETDPVFKASASYGITSTNISNWNGKQDKLTSGTNIKTINGLSLLGSGNIDTTPEKTSSNLYEVENGVYKVVQPDGAVGLDFVMTDEENKKVLFRFDSRTNTVLIFKQESSTSELEFKTMVNFDIVLSTDNIQYTFTKDQAIANEWEDMIPTIYAVYKYIEDNIQAITNAEIDNICK